jgi:hypothetical protein
MGPAVGTASLVKAGRPAPAAVGSSVERLVERAAHLPRITLGAVVALAATNVVAVARPELTPADLIAVAGEAFFAGYLPLLLVAVVGDATRSFSGPIQRPLEGGAAGGGDSGAAVKAIRRTTGRPPAPSTTATVRAPSGRSHSTG